MNSLIYLGEVPSDRQSVSETLAARGINYLRSEPSKIVPVMHLDHSLPPYDIYKNNLQGYIRAAVQNNPVLLNDPYMPLESTFTLSCMPSKIPVIFSFGSRIRDETRDYLKQKYMLEDTLAKGKPALKGQMTFEEMKELIKDHNPVQTTPTSNTHINLASAKHLRLLHRILGAFFRLQQYPTRRDGQLTGFMDGSVDVAIPVDDEPDANMTIDTEEQHWVTYLLAKETRYMAHSNLPVPFKDYRPEINSSNNIPVGSGLCLAYVRELCLPDYRIIPAVVSRYFLGLLGSDAEEAQEVFEGLKGSWGNICRTELGFELAHLFWSAAFAIESRSQIVAIVPSSGVYVGCIVIGEGYKVDIRNRLVEPCVRSDLVEAFGSLSPHDSSLAKIYWLLTYAQDEARIQDREACKSFQQLRRDVVNHPYRSDKKAEVEKLAMQLVFPGAEPLTPTPYNVAVVLGAIADETKAEDGFPLYPRCITEDSRATRLLSAFGHYAPSFLVPGGKLMMLDKPFEVSVGTKKGGGDDNRRIVTKIGFIMKPLDQAVADLLRVREIKGVHNPHGSNIMGRTSANSLIRSAETENASSIVYALRMYTGTSVADVVAGKKRARDEGVQGEGSKKRRVDDW